MTQFITYLINFFKSYDRGNLGDFSDPENPADLDEPLTQDEINWVKKFKKEMDERFAEPEPEE